MYFANQGPATFFLHFQRTASRQYYRKEALSLGEYNFFPASMDEKFHDKKLRCRNLVLVKRNISLGL